MKNTFASLAMAGLAAAQQIDIAQINAAPLPATTVAPVLASAQSVEAFNPAAVASSIYQEIKPTHVPSVNINEKRQGGSCAPQPAGTGPHVEPDTDVAFEQYPLWSYDANTHIALPPYIEKFRNLNGTVQQNSYLNFYYLTSYDVQECAQLCDNNDLCSAFNVYIERDPSLDPGAACPNPPSVSNYKCALWGSSISAQTATNQGQYRQNFHVVVAGSNGYDKTPFLSAQSVDGFSAAANISGQAITGASKFFLGSEFFTGPYDPAVCGDYATAQTLVNKQSAIASGAHAYQAANSFNAFYVFRGGVAWGTYCTLFDSNVNASYASNADVTSGGFSYTVGSSWVYHATATHAGVV